jgi:prevent-host-death family protein
MRQSALQDAKAGLSDLVRLASEHEPQEITLLTLRGEPAVVVSSREERFSAWLDIEIPGYFAGRVVNLDSTIADR